MRNIKGSLVWLSVFLFASGAISAPTLWRLDVRKQVVPFEQWDFVASAALPAWITSSGATNGTRINSSGVIVAGTSPRFDYNGALLTGNGMLVEPANTNLALQSNSLANASWTVLNAALSTDSTTAPDGTTAEKLTSASGANIHRISSTLQVTVITGSVYTESWFVKAGTYNYPSIALYSTQNNWLGAVFDLSSSANVAASQTAVGATTGTILATNQVNMGGGWFKISVTGFLTGTVASSILQFASGATGNSFGTFGSLTTTMAGTESFYAALVQFELGPVASSVVKTTSGSTTQTADVPTIPAQSASGPTLLEIKDEATGVVSRIGYAPGLFVWPATGIWARKIAVYPTGTPMSYVNSHLGVGSGF